MTARIHTLPSPARHNAANLTSVPVDLRSRGTSPTFGIQTSLLLQSWSQSVQAGKAMADALQVRIEARGKR